MARRMTPRELELLAQSFEPALRKAFLDAIHDIRNQASTRMVAELIAAGRVDTLADVLGISAPRFAPLLEALRAAYLKAGLATVLEIPPLRSSAAIGPWQPSRNYQVRWNFDITNPQAEAWLRERSSNLVTAIVEDQREAIRIAAAEGMALGRGPRQTALDIVGRVGTSGRRAGGVVGLTSQQAQFVTNARAELSDPGRMAKYFTRTRRDKRFDATVRKAMREGRPLSAEQIDKIVGRYGDRLLALRGETIARVESLTSMSAAREEGYRQAIAAGDLLPENVIGTWGATGDTQTRHSHMAMNGQKRQFGEPFVTPSGAMMLFPGDTSMGAGAEETINCRCNKTYRINYAGEATRGQG